MPTVRLIEHPGKVDHSTYFKNGMRLIDLSTTSFRFGIDTVVDEIRD